MKLPFITKKDVPKEFFLVLLLSSGKVGAILFEKGAALGIVDRQEERLTKPLDTLDPNQLIEAADVVISAAEQKLPEGSHLEKTIFAVPQRWVEEGKIKKEHLVVLKKICESLELTPVGFVVSIEALTSHLHRIEGAPVSAIVIEVGEQHVTVSIVKNGQILFVSEKEISEGVIKTTEEILLTQEATEVLPSKIILLNFDDAQKIQQDFLVHKWSKSLPFLHIPQVTVLDPEIESQAVITGVASQMGFDNMSPIAKPESATQPEPEKIEQEKEAEDTEAEKGSGIEDVIVFSGEASGFYKEKDVQLEKEMQSDVVSEPAVYDHANVAPLRNDENQEKNREIVQQPERYGENKSVLSQLRNVFSFSFLSGLMPFQNSFSIKNKLYLYPIAGVILVLVLGFLYYFMFEKATVTLYLDKKEVAKDMQVTFSTEDATSSEDEILQIQTRSITVDGEKSKQATGVKETGEKAKGEVTILSSVNKETIIEKGSSLKGPNGLGFILDSEVKIASSSGVSDIKSVKGKVTAAEFGKEYNIPSGSKFTITGYDTSSVEGKNDTAFSGGSSREITVVSENDLVSLEEDVLEQLTGEALANAASEKDPEEELLDSVLSYAFDTKTFSHKKDQEATSVNLKASITFELGVYKKSDLLELAKEASGKEVEEDFVFSEKDSKITINEISTEKGITSAQFAFLGVYLPKIEAEGLSGKVTGKNSENAYELLSQPGVKNVEVEFTRSIPFLPKILPFNKNNITVVTKASS